MTYSSGSLDDPRQSITALTHALSHTGIRVKALHQNGVDILFEPFFRRVLRNSFHKNLQLLRKKTRIYVEKGRLLMGVLDEVGILEEDEVYVCCTSLE